MGSLRWALGGSILPVVGVAVAITASGAAAATLKTIDTPSAHVDPADVTFNGADHPGELRANVLLPDGYDGRRRFPVLYLLHGIGDSYATWARPERGDVVTTTAGLEAIVVMPEADIGFFANWWNGGARGEPGWERFYLDELVPLVERRFRVRRARRWHAIAGLSMGGLGATFLASQLPGYFGSAATFSGFVQHQRPESGVGLSLFAGAGYEDIFGPIDGFYAAGHNPSRLTDNLRSTRVYVTVGNGVAQPGTPSSPAATTFGGVEEAALRLQAEEFVAAARASGVDVTYRPLLGVHDWPYWRSHLRAVIAWGLFEAVPEAPSSWTYGTVSQRGDAWGLRYSFAAPPAELVTLSRDGRMLRAAGSGTVTVRNEARCGFTAELPFERAMPPRTCGRLGASVRRRGGAGPTTRVEVRVTRRVRALRLPVHRARVSIGRNSARTGRHGRATLRYRPRRSDTPVLRVSARGLGSLSKTLPARGG